MKTVRLALVAFVAALTLDGSAQERLRLGLLPFDIANVDGGTHTAASALAKLVRAEMITNRRVQPVLVELSPGDRLPLSPQKLAALAESHDVHVIVAGTVLEATTTRGRNRVSTGGLGGAFGSVGGNVTRTRAEVRMHVELSGRDGEVSESFQVEGTETDVGLGADIWTSLGSFNGGDANWDKSPMGKALREAAERLTAEVIKRKGKSGR